MEGPSVPDLDAVLGRVASSTQPHGRGAVAPLPQEAKAPLQKLLDHLEANFDGDMQPFVACLDFLSGRRRLAAAEAVADLFVRACPDHPLPQLKAANLKRMRGEWNEVASRARTIRQRFPDCKEAASMEVHALRNARRRDEARAVVLETLDESAPHRPLLVEACWLAMLMGDWDGTLRLAAIARAHFPDEMVSFVTAPAALQAQRRYDEAAAMLRDAEDHFPGAPWILVGRAKLATARADYATSEKLWAEVRQVLPDDITGYVSGAKALQQTGREAEAEVLLGQAFERFPAHREVTVQRAKLAAVRRDWTEADARWTAARRQFPKDFDIALQYALVPAGRGKRGLEPAIARLAEVTAAYPDQPLAVMHTVRLKREHGDLEGSEQAGAAGRARFPDFAGIALEYARTLTRAERLQEAADVLSGFLAAHTGEATIRVELADLLSQTGRHDEAEHLAAAALEQLPFHPSSHIVHARVASRRGDMEAAKLRWDHAVARFPNDLDIRKGAYGAEQVRMAERDAASGEALVEMPPLAAADNDLAAIFANFESLGGLGQGCEFGLVQRLSGIEPLGLLRWARLQPDDLEAALDAAFEGVGTPEQTELTFYETKDNDPEYSVRDRRFGMDMHTFTRKSDIAFDKMFRSSCRRLAFLKDKLLDDFATGDKIFVYKIFDRNLDRDHVSRIHRLMQRYGRATLLYVRYSDEAHAGGTVEWWGERLLVGYIQRFSMTMDGQARTPLMAEWVSICSNALEMCRKKEVLF
jgi:tetratricopeptide (TPR) repeat protein